MDAGRRSGQAALATRLRLEHGKEKKPTGSVPWAFFCGVISRSNDTSVAATGSPHRRCHHSRGCPPCTGLCDHPRTQPLYRTGSARARGKDRAVAGLDRIQRLSPAELDNGRSFSWMGGAGRLRLARLDRSVAIKLSFWVQPAVGPPVELKASVDGLSVPPITLVPGPQRVDIDLPAARAGRATVDLSVSETVVPGAADSRTLGLRVDGIALEAADGRIRIPWDSLRSATIAGFGLGIALALTLGVRPLAFALGLGAGGWLGFLVAFDVAFLGAYPDRLAVVGLCTAAFGALCSAGMRGGADERWGLRAASGVLVVLTACKLALFLHPMAAVGDSIFHVHRAQVVQRGEYFFTSITPRPFLSSPTPRDSTCSSVLYGTPCMATWNTSGFSDRRSSERKRRSQLPSTRSCLPTGAAGWRHAPQARLRFCFRWGFTRSARRTSPTHSASRCSASGSRCCYAHT